jgi:TrmH family RNA methyltransferase
LSSKEALPLKPLKWYQELADIKGRREVGAFLVEGERAIRQIMDYRPDEILEIIALSEPPDDYCRYLTRRVTREQFRSICQTQTPQGIMAVVRLPPEAYTDRLPEKVGNKVLLLEDIQDPGNVGTLIRTAAAFDFSGVLLTEKCADPFSPKCVQSTAGSVLAVWLRRSARYLELVSELKVSGFTLIAADLEGTADPSVLGKGEKLLLGLGNEAAGISESLLGLSDYRVRITIASDKAESLNVAACGAIFMYLASTRMR